GGINGKKLVLDIFDDRNDPQLAGIKALEIAEQTQAMAVIGHWYSSASISAGEVYKTYHIPAITPGSVNIQVTENNPWYFRNIYNAKASGQFLANYVKKVFHQNTVTIIHEQAAFGAYLANVFENTAQDLGIKVKNKWHFNKKNPNIDNVLADIVNQLDQQQQQAGVVLLAVQALEGVKLVKLIKDKGISNTIIGESSFSEETFRHGFDKYPIEQANPGYYVNDIYVATPLIFDTANEKAQDFRDEYLQKYQEEPDWSAAYAYDSAMILVKALKEAGIEGDLAALPAERALIRDTLASYTRVEEALEGVTGYNYFDHNRDAQKTVSLGVYKNKDSVSALTQLHPMRNTFEINDLKKALEEERILLINDKYMYKTNVVYTGIQVNEISELDFKKTFSCTLDFYLWFRFQGDFTPENIEFTNAIEPIQLGQPVNEKTKDKITYRLYRVKGQFKIDFLSRFFYKQHTLGISFHHKELTRNNLIFVADILGMGLRDEANLLRKMAKKQVLNPTSGWEINHVWFFENVIRKSSLGDPRYLNIKKGTVEYSQFNAGVRIQSSEFSLRGKIPYKYSYDLMALSGIMIIVFVFLSNQFKSFSRLIWFFQVIFAFLLLLTGEVLLVDWLSEHTSMYHLKSIIQSFDVLWWIIPAFLLTLASERFVWTPLEEQMGPVPNIIRIFFALIIYFLAILG
ncbi:MAG: ABC transporter substrate-binding protein, partial [Pseudomonadota bacterium]|nr:ABC transporter substrate-binding protein [Pseudomonadota bacterium]